MALADDMKTLASAWGANAADLRAGIPTAGPTEAAAALHVVAATYDRCAAAVLGMVEASDA